MPLQRSEVPTTKWSAYNEVKYTSTIISHAD